MKKTFIFSLLAISLFMFACQSEANDPESIKKEINDYENQIIDLKSKIAVLKHQLDTMNSSLDDGKILVSYEETKPTTFVNYIDVVGNVESDLQSNISPEINGQIDKIFVKEGDFVKQGSLMATLTTTITQKNIQEVKTSLELAKTVYSKQKDLWDQKIGSELQYLQAKNNVESLESRLATLRAQLDMAEIKAPFDGIVETVFQKEGEIAAPGMMLFEFVNLQSLKVEADVSEAYIANIKVGDSAWLWFPSFSDLELSASVSVVGSIINPNNRTFKVQINIPNQDSELKPNLIANLKLIQATYENTLVVPSIIVKNDAMGNKYLYVMQKDGDQMIAKKRFITTGVSYGSKTQIVDGLSAGDKVIVKGYNTVKNGSLVRTK
jgi:membrane fusion protein (multidrug efflux system)